MDTKKLRQKILDLAIHGKLVPQDPNDEPASVLLERIRAEKEQLIKEGKIKKSRKTSSSSDTPHYEQVPFEVPQGWVWTTLGEIGTWQAGGTPNRSNKAYYGGNIPWLKTGDLNDGLITNIPESITEEAVSNSSAKLNPEGSVLIAMYGATIGKLGILTFPATTNQACCACVKHDTVAQMYLFYFLMSQRTSFIEKGGGGAQPNISKEIIINTEIPLPPLKEQFRIAAQIDHWFSIIGQLESGKENLRAYVKNVKNKILDLAIHGKLVPQDPNDEPASELLKRINPKVEITCDNAHYGKLPDRWCLTKLGAIGRWQSGGTPSRANSEYYVGDIPWLKIANLQDGYVKECSEKISNEAICNSSAKINPEGSIALAMYGSIGKLGILTFPAATNQAICVCSSFMGVDAKYLFFFLMSQRDEFVLKAGGGVQANISKEIIINHQIAIPPLPEQLRIVSKIDNLFSLLNDIESSLQA